MYIKGIIRGLLLFFGASLVAVFIVPIVVGNDSKDFKILMAIIVFVAGASGVIQELLWQRKQKKGQK